MRFQRMETLMMNDSKTPMIDTAILKEQAKGQWELIFQRILGLDLEDIIKRGGIPCPSGKCDSKKDAFHATRHSRESGIMGCRKCLGDKYKDGIGVIQWLTGCSFAEAKLSIANVIGISVGDFKPVRRRESIIEAVVRIKSIPDVDCLMDYGASEQGTRLTFPVYDQFENQVSSFSIWPHAVKGSKELKGKCEAGKPRGMFLPHDEKGNVIKPNPGETWIVCEGVKDAATWRWLGYNTIGISSDKFLAYEISILEGCHVVLAPDRQKQSFDYAEYKVAPRLNRKAASVRLLALPFELDNEEGKDDIRDLLKERNGNQTALNCFNRARVLYGSLPSDDAKIEAVSKLTKERLASYAEGKVTGRKIGFKRVDGMLDPGVAAGTLAVIAAPSSHGKTMMALQLMNTFAKDTKVDFYSLEMTSDFIADRIITYSTATPKRDWRSQAEHVEMDLQEYNSTRIDPHVISDIHTIDELELNIKERFNTGTKIVFIDYYQRIESSIDHRYHALTDIHRRLKNLVLNTDKNIFLLAQLNKRVLDRKPMIPRQDDVEMNKSLFDESDYFFGIIWPHKVDEDAPREG